MRSRVDLPQPEGPTMQTKRELATVMSTWLRASTGPLLVLNTLETPLTVISQCAAALCAILSVASIQTSCLHTA